jgi:hypothetical protein
MAAVFLGLAGALVGGTAWAGKPSGSDGGSAGGGTIRFAADNRAYSTNSDGAENSVPADLVVTRTDDDTLRWTYATAAGVAGSFLGPITVVDPPFSPPFHVRGSVGSIQADGSILADRSDCIDLLTSTEVQGNGAVVLLLTQHGTGSSSMPSRCLRLVEPLEVGESFSLRVVLHPRSQ